MKPSNEKELHQLAEMLRELDERLERVSLLHGPVKAGLASTTAFVNDLRLVIERQYDQVGAPLTETQHAHLLSMGINPDTLK